jgi:formylglycine-generating enzyme required for sulfatase activity
LGGVQAQGDLFVQDTVAAHGTETKTDTRTRVFISYSRKDMAFADKLESALKARGFNVLIDRQEIYAFEDWWKRIQSLIGQSDTVVFVLSPDSVKSDVALKEVDHAASLNKRFAPIVCRRVDDAAVPEALRRLNFIFFDDPARFEAGVDRLADALRTDIGWVRQHTEYGEAERRWSAAGQPNSLLLRSPTLDVAEYWMGSRPASAPEPTGEIRLFVTTSRKAEVVARRRNRILNVTLYTLLVGIILGLVGWIKQDIIADKWRFVTVTWPYERANVRPYVLSAAKEQALKPGDSFKECAQDCPEMVVVPAGSFTMGSPSTEKNRFVTEGPQHPVTFAKNFAVSKYELTFTDWGACVIGGGCDGYKPTDENWGRGQQPVINVGWDDARRYVTWLSLVTGKTYRLLSEAEYEYATRAGTATVYPWGDDIKLNGQAMADCNGCGSQWDALQTAPVGSFRPNGFGLYDMVGNVWEWVEDCVHLSYDNAPKDGAAWLANDSGDCTNRVLRAGSWDVNPVGLRSANRNGNTPGARTALTGFRVARTLMTP